MVTASPSEDESVARALGTLASATRIGLLRALRTPRRLGEIMLPAAASGTGGSMSRQAVREHLDKLVESGMVIEREAQGDARSPHEYVINHQAIFALVEELKGLARLRPVVELPVPTAPLAARETSPPEGPRLLLVKGLDEGTVFDLRPGSAPPSEWILGRRRGLAISLDFDPYVSAENSVLRWREGKHWICDGPESRNGTFLNLQPLARGEERPLRHGDLIGVGRSLLLYWS